jgi:hypothetical protein
MKIIFFAVFIYLGSVFSNCAHAQPGRHAGATFKKMIGSCFSDERTVAGLEDFELYESTLLNRLDDPERLFLQVYAKGSERVVLFSALTDTISFHFTVHDVLHLKNVKAEFEFKSVTCRKNKVEDPQILALLIPAERMYINSIKRAWICDWEKKAFINIPVNGIDCLNEGYEQF